MKYLKKFENISNRNEQTLIDLQRFCDNHLAYLSDEGFRYMVYISNTNTALPTFRIVIDKRDKDDGGVLFFSIKEIEDELIQFLEYLREQYTIIPFIGNEIEIKDRSGYFYNYTIDDMSNNTGIYKEDSGEMSMKKYKSIEIMKVSNLKPKKLI